MKVLVIDVDGLSFSLAYRIAQAGHEVRWFVKPSPDRPLETGKGFKGVQKINNWLPSAKWADLILPLGNSDYLPRLDSLRKEGFPVFGPSVKSADLEIKRSEGMKIFEKHGIDVVPYTQFNSMKEAYNHVKKTEERFVFKTLGDNEDKSLTYVSKSPADLMGWLENRIKDTPIKGPVMLQTFVEGIELGVSRWMGSKGWVGPWNESFEHKKLMSGNFGPNTGEMGTVASYTKESKLGEETLAKLEDVFMKLGHMGDTAIGFMIDKSGKPWPTEFTCRTGFPINLLMLSANLGDPVEWMLDAINGKDSTNFTEEIGTCLVVAQPPFPGHNDDLKKTTGVPIYGVKKSNKKYIHPLDVKIDIMPDMEGGKVVTRPVWNTTGEYVVVVTGFGETVKQSRERAYKTVDQLHIANMIVRDDIGEKMEKTLPDLHKMGYAMHFKFGDKDD